MAYTRRKRVGKYTYYQEVESYRDEQGRPRQRVLKHHGRNPPGDNRPLDEREARQVANKITQDPPTQQELKDILTSLGVPTGDWAYERLGVELDLEKKTRHLRLR